MSTRLNRAIRGELHRLVSLKILTFEELQKLAPRYPVTPWNLTSLVRWFTILGAVCFGAGLLILVPKVVQLQNAIDVGLVLATAGFVAGGLWLERRRGLAKTGAAMQLLGSFTLQGLIVALAIRFSTGSDNWPELVGICACATALLAYGLGSRLILIHALVNAYTAFGGETGYMSGWGAYWLEMDYPTRFIAAGLVALALAWIHARYVPGVRQGFSRVYAHFGLLVLNLALWFFSLFGFYDDVNNYRWSNHDGQRLIFTGLWLVLSLAALFGGSKFAFRMARGYGLTFLIINIYTFYFQFIVAKSGELWFIHMLLVGGSMVGLGVWLERRFSSRREAKAEVPPTQVAG